MRIRILQVDIWRDKIETAFSARMAALEHKQRHLALYVVSDGMDDNFDSLPERLEKFHQGYLEDVEAVRSTFLRMRVRDATALQLYLDAEFANPEDVKKLWREMVDAG